MKALIIQPDGVVRDAEFTQVYPDLNEALGVHTIQGIYVPGLAFWLDEDGKYNDNRTKRNPLAHALFISLGGRLRHGDYLVGPVAITGEDDNGQPVSVPDQIVGLFPFV